MIAGVRTPERTGAETLCIALADGKDREEIYRIRHDVYAQELQQHPPSASTRLSDSLDATNVYLVATLGRKVAGFVSVTPRACQVTPLTNTLPATRSPS